MRHLCRGGPLTGLPLVEISCSCAAFPSSHHIGSGSPPPGRCFSGGESPDHRPSLLLEGNRPPLLEGDCPSLLLLLTLVPGVALVEVALVGPGLLRKVAVTEQLLLPRAVVEVMILRRKGASLKGECPSFSGFLRSLVEGPCIRHGHLLLSEFMLSAVGATVSHQRPRGCHLGAVWLRARPPGQVIRVLRARP